MVPETLSSGFSVFYCWLRRAWQQWSRRQILSETAHLAPFHPGLRPFLPILWRSLLSSHRRSIFVIMSISYKNTIRGDCLNRGSWLNSQIYVKPFGSCGKWVSLLSFLAVKEKKKKKASCTLNYPSITDHKIPIALHVIYSSRERRWMRLPGS